MSSEVDDLEFRDDSQRKEEKYNDERISTQTSREQKKTENAVETCFQRFEQLKSMLPRIEELFREEHMRYLKIMVKKLPKSYECLDSSRPWCVYWILQAAKLLGLNFDDETLENIVQFLIKCRSVTGGFGGGPGQHGHLAPTYAAVNSLSIIGTKNALEAIDRESLKNFLFSLRQPDGSFQLHQDGEVDVRGAYCAISCAKLTNMPESVIRRLFDGSGDWIANCQTYEGGFGGAPGLEAHGGYTFCGMAALALLNEEHKCDIQALLRWSLKKQMSFEGGFQGRTNKLVDGCYSFWVGATISIIQPSLALEEGHIHGSIFDVAALQEYILLCCQNQSGGLIDKPGKPQDLHHTCYALSGIAIAQHLESGYWPQILGPQENEIFPTHPLFNVPPEAASAAIRYFDNVNKNYKSQGTEEENY